MADLGLSAGAAALAVDRGGQRLLFGGSFSGSVTFAGHSFVSGGPTDPLVGALDASTGKVLWADQILGSQDNDAANAVCVDASGYLYVAGRYFGGAPPRLAEPGGARRGFVAKYRLDGGREWVKVLATGEAQAIVCDAPRGILLAVDSPNNLADGGVIRVAP